MKQNGGLNKLHCMLVKSHYLLSGAPNEIYVDAELFPCFSHCTNPITVNTRIISGMLLCREKKANQMQDEKPQAVTLIIFVACGFRALI